MLRLSTRVRLVRIRVLVVVCLVTLVLNAVTVLIAVCAVLNMLVLVAIALVPMPVVKVLCVLASVVRRVERLLVEMLPMSQFLVPTVVRTVPTLTTILREIRLYPAGAGRPCPGELGFVT